MKPAGSGQHPDAADWAERYRLQSTPWDRGIPHPELAARLREDHLGRRRCGHDARAFVPGCGRGHDALALAESGWHVTAMDLVAELESVVTPRLKVRRGRFVCGDALGFHCQPLFELLWEHTFFCALPPEHRPAYGAMARRLVAYRGHLAAIVFPADRPREAGGPPHRMTVEDLAEALGGGFRLLETAPVAHPCPGREWSEHWALFERLDTEDATEA